MSFFSFFFGWYHGAVWSNLLASVIWALPGFVLLDRRHKKRHEELKDHITQRTR